MAKRVYITWDDEREAQAREICKRYAKEMREAGIMPEVPKRDGSIAPNISGAIAYALMQLDKGKSK